MKYRLGREFYGDMALSVFRIMSGDVLVYSRPWQHVATCPLIEGLCLLTIDGFDDVDKRCSVYCTRLSQLHHFQPYTTHSRYPDMDLFLIILDFLGSSFSPSRLYFIESIL